MLIRDRAHVRKQDKQAERQENSSYTLFMVFGNMRVLYCVFLCVPGWCMCASACLCVCLDAQTAMYNAYTTDLLMTKLFI